LKPVCGHTLKGPGLTGECCHSIEGDGMSPEVKSGSELLSWSAITSRVEQLLNRNAQTCEQY